MSKPLYTVIHNEAAYDEATRKRIRENARKGRGARWLAEDETRADLVARLNNSTGEFMTKMAKAVQEWGSLSDKQEAAVRSIFAKADARKAEARDRDAGSQHVGTIGKRQEWTLTVRSVVLIEATDWSDAFRITIMNDAAGNVIVYKGNSLQMEVCDAVTGNPTQEVEYTMQRPERGQTVQIVATVKDHSERDGIKQTIINRPKLKAINSAE